MQNRDGYKIGEFDITGDDVKSFGTLPENDNIAYEITRVKTDKYVENREFYLLKMWGDIRVKKISITTDATINKELLDTQPVYNAYFGTFGMAKKIALKTIEMLSGNSKYRNMYQQRDELNIKRWNKTIKSPIFNIIDKKTRGIEINGNIVHITRDIIKPYLEANLKGTGYVYAEREGFAGTPKPLTKYHKNKFVIVDITDKIVYTVKTPYGDETFTAPKLELHSDNIADEYFLACEYVIAKIWEAKFNIEKTDVEHYTI